jgi:hypothetical protein
LDWVFDAMVAAAACSWCLLVCWIAKPPAPFVQTQQLLALF